MVKRKPHHSLVAVQRKFASTETLEITTSAIISAQSIGYARHDIVDIVQQLTHKDFAKSETAHHPPNSRIWHDTYRITADDMRLYLKFAGETLIDVILVSFKEG